MQLTHEFTVPASPAETWAALNDIESVAGCFPGAAVTSVEGDTFQGTCKVKLGPIALVYGGSGTFVEKDEAAGLMRIEAKGKDKRGNGTAGADVVATLAPAGEGTTVRVVTDLSITGKPAQFGRGVMQDVSDKLLAQFVECLRERVGTAGAPSPEEGHPQAATAPEAAPEAGTEAAPPPAQAPPPRAQAAHDDSLDLGATVVPVLLRTYGPKLAAGLLALVLVRLVLRGLSRR